MTGIAFISIKLDCRAWHRCGQGWASSCQASSFQSREACSIPDWCHVPCRLPKVALHWTAGLLMDCSKERHGVNQSVGQVGGKVGADSLFEGCTRVLTAKTLYPGLGSPRHTILARGPVLFWPYTKDCMQVARGCFALGGRAADRLQQGAAWR